MSLKHRLNLFQNIYFGNNHVNKMVPCFTHFIGVCVTQVDTWTGSQAKTNNCVTASTFFKLCNM